ncbi:MBL fold metallo-hydrolase [Bacillus sp. B-jedd]|uniref:MBL fold metallo-hydrolase n=1 Tax=Bacillus sp. B-jedd TaxID=1476857 RepID=UPI00051572D0|nr:MBL fold metallo-hydrolase [Bacillus sp. B-jedd]CEG29281.1 Zn-dependent hydrolase [Bacillus sp. B-jedd]
MHQIKQLSEHVWYLPASHETDRPVLGAVLGQDYSLLIDAGNSPAHAELFLNELKRIGASESRLLVLTHWHWDHIFGTKKMNLPAIAHAKTKLHIDKLKGLQWTDEALDERVRTGVEIEFCAEMIKKEFGEKRDEIKIVSPVMTFEDSLAIDLGGVHVRLKHVGGDHADDSTVVFIEEDSVLFLGDCYSPNMYAKKWHYNTPVFLKLLNELEEYQASFYIHSHANPATQEEFYQELFEMRAINRAALENKGDTEATLSAMKAALGRDPNEDEIEFASFFE